MKFPPMVLLLASLALAACSRSSKDKPIEDATVTTGSRLQDTPLTLAPLPLEQRLAALQLKDVEMPTADYLRLAEDLRELALLTEGEAMGAFARELVTAFREAPGSAPKVKFADSLYARAVTGEGEPEVQKQTAVLARELKKAVAGLSQLLDASRRQFPWPRRLDNLTQAVEVLDAYVAYLLERLPGLGLDPELVRPVAAAIRAEHRQRRPEILALIERLHNARHLSQALPVLKNALKSLGVALPPAERALLAKADALARMLEGLRSSQDALTMLIHVWRMIPPENRERIFRPVSAELTDFFRESSESDLDCFARSFCGNPILEIKRMVILPKLEQHGVANIGAQVNTAARDYLVQAARDQATAFLPNTPELVKDQVLAQASRYQALVKRIQSDFPGFVKQNLGRWAKEEFPVEMRALDSGRVRVRLPSRARLQVAPFRTKEGVANGAEALGLSLSLAQSFLPENRQQRRAILLEPIMKLMAITGFRQVGGRPFASLLFPLDGPRDELFNVRELLQGRTSFAVPDAFLASNDFLLQRGAQSADAGVGAQAELLRGIARQIRFHRDWEKNEFDETLGSVQVEDVAPEIPAGAVNFSLFPKDMIFALAVGGGGAILQNIIRDLSPAFLMLSEKEILWGNEYEKITNGKISTVAGLVDISGGQRNHTVRTAHVARYVLALDEFLGATEGIEGTKAAPLLERGEDGRTVLDKLLDARRHLKLFMMGLTNYLVYVAQKPDGGFMGQHQLEGVRLQASGDRTLSDQILAIRALNASARRLEMPLYAWSAVDGFYFLNRHLWDPAQQFYASSVNAKGERHGKPDIRSVTATLRGLEETAAHLTGDSRRQWDRISQPWREALESF